MTNRDDGGCVDCGVDDLVLNAAGRCRACWQAWQDTLTDVKRAVLAALTFPPSTTRRSSS